MKNKKSLISKKLLGLGSSNHAVLYFAAIGLLAIITQLQVSHHFNSTKARGVHRLDTNRIIGESPYMQTTSVDEIQAIANAQGHDVFIDSVDETNSLVLVFNPENRDEIFYAASFASQSAINRDPLPNEVKKCQVVIDGVEQDCYVQVWPNGKIYSITKDFNFSASQTPGIHQNQANALIKSFTEKLNQTSNTAQVVNSTNPNTPTINLHIVDNTIPVKGHEQDAGQMVLKNTPATATTKASQVCDVYLNLQIVAKAAQIYKLNQKDYLEQVFVHETGHCLGLGHSEDGVMKSANLHTKEWYSNAQLKLLADLKADKQITVSNCTRFCKIPNTVYVFETSDCICKTGYVKDALGNCIPVISQNNNPNNDTLPTDTGDGFWKYINALPYIGSGSYDPPKNKSSDKPTSDINICDPGYSDDGVAGSWCGDRFYPNEDSEE